MNIKVTNCKDCPFCGYESDGDYSLFCMAHENKSIPLNEDDEPRQKFAHFCPLHDGEIVVSKATNITYKSPK